MNKMENQITPIRDKYGNVVDFEVERYIPMSETAREKLTKELVGDGGLSQYQKPIRERIYEDGK